MKCCVRIAVVITLATLSTAKQLETLKVPISPEEVAQLSFDPSRVSHTDLRNWMKFHDSGPYTEPISIGMCFPDRGYTPCEQNSDSINIHNAALNLDRIQRVISNLERETYPPELAGIVAHLIRVRRFWLWSETQQLEFIKSGQIAALSGSYDRVDPEVDCAASLQQIREAKSQAESSHLAQFEWSNCVWDAEQKKIGLYPKEQWKAFLASYGIREKILTTERD